MCIILHSFKIYTTGEDYKDNYFQCVIFLQVKLLPQIVLYQPLLTKLLQSENTEVHVLVNFKQILKNIYGKLILCM